VVPDVRLLPSTRLGAGEPLLMLHGLGAARGDFSRVVPLLVDDFDVIAVDLPGQGDAPAPPRRPTVRVLGDLLEGDLDARGLGRVHILGNSLGGRLALELARRDRARSVVAIAPSGLSLPPERAYQMTGMALTGALVAALQRRAPRLLDRKLPRAALLTGLRARPWRATDDDLDAFVGGFGSPHFWRMLLWAIGPDVALDLGAVRCPVLLAQGGLDWVAAGQTVRFLATTPSARFRLLPLAGHSAHEDVPRQVAQLVRQTAARAA